MSSTPYRRNPLGQAVRAIGVRQWALVAVLALGAVGGELAGRKPSDAYLISIVVAAPLFLAVLGERAFPWMVVIVAVLPWYPFVTESSQLIVKQKVLCAAIAAAPLVPWLWSLALGGRRTRPSRFALLMGVLYAGLAVLIYSTVGGVSGMIESNIVGFLFAGVTFLCARRFGSQLGWPAAALGGLIILLLLGLDAVARAPSSRVGYFVGYPITYGALIVALLPLGLLAAYRRSRLLAGTVALGAGAMIILSQSRSSWIAVVAMVIVAVMLQVRAGNVRALAAVLASAVLLAVLVTSTSSLSGIVEKRLNSNLTQAQSFTHRDWSYNFALTKIGQAPVFGAGVVGFSAEESTRRTNIGAIDNGYLSITVDMGIFGLFAAMIPIAVAILALARCLRYGLVPPYEVSLALGIVGLAFVTIFYDSFYWAQIDLLLGALGGALSVRLGAIRSSAELAAGRPVRRRRPRRRIRWAT